MNAIRVSERIIDGMARYIWAAPSHAKNFPTLSEVRSAPLLTIPAVDVDLNAKIDAIKDGDGWLWGDGAADMPRLPFPVMRVYWPKTNAQVEAQGIIWSFGGGELSCMAYFHGDGIVMAGAFGRFVQATKQMRAVGYVLVKRGRVERDQDVPSVLCTMSLSFLWHYAYPAFQPVMVSPSADVSLGRSAEWKMARTYYSVVHRRSGSAGGKGLSPHARSVAMAAHSRRAHERVLRSEKWGASMGKRVWVRSAWVGPKEWQDAESKQVYRVVESFGGQ